MKQLIFLISLAFSMIFLFHTESYAQDYLRQVGYLKDGSRNRIFTFEYKKGTPVSTIRSFTQNLINTQGQITAAYFYREGSRIPADGVTLAGSVFRANNVLYDMQGLSKWKYAYMKGFNGSAQFVDCKKTPKNDLCRK